MNVAALCAEDIAVHYGGVKAVDGVGLAVEQGQIAGLIGPNGAGKSTLIDAITGRKRLSRGRLSLSGVDISDLDVVQRRARGLSRSFQKTSIFGQMSVRRQLDLASYNVGGKDSAADTEEILGELDLSKVGDILAADLGYGEQRRLDLALALVGSPSVLLLDEPMAGLSIQESRDLALHLKRLAKSRGVSVLLVEHDMEIVFSICDIVIVLELGRIIASGTPAEVRADPRVREAYLGSAA